MTFLRRVRILIAYNGAAFRGAAVNPGVRTVVGDLTDAASLVLRCPIEFTLAGRTDAGVHAWGQVLSADLPAHTDLDELGRRLNKLCGPDIAVRDIAWADADFDARFSATSRSYRYHVWNDRAPNPLRSHDSWHVPQPLDLAAMHWAAGHLTGEHDFASFCRRPKPAAGAPQPSLVRIMYDVGWTRVADTPMLRFEVLGSAFCHQQVRSMVGTCVEIGLGRIAADALPAIIAARDRAAAGRVAPPEGLIMWQVGYDGTRWDAHRPAG